MSPRRTGMPALLATALSLALSLSAFGCAGKTASRVEKAPDLGVVKHLPAEESTALETSAGLVVPDRILVLTAPGPKSRAVAEKAAQAAGGAIATEISYIGLYAVALDAPDEASLTRAAGKAAAVDGVEGASPDPLAAPGERVEGQPCSVIGDDPVYEGANARPYEMIGAERAWKVVRASGLKLGAVQVGVTDGGLYRGQGEFGGKAKVVSVHPDEELAAAENDKQGKPRPHGSHGSAVTGIIAADPDNGGQVGVASVLGDKMSVRHTNVFSNTYGNSKVPTDLADVTQYQSGTGSISEGNLVGLLEQVKAGSKVINCSWGSASPGPQHALISKAYRRFFSKMSEDYPDVVFVLAAGNNGKSYKGHEMWPAGAPLPNCVTVGCLENDGSKVHYSNTSGDDFEVTIAAPGHRVVSGVGPDGTVRNIDGGTSFAAPQVTSAIAMIKALNPKLTAAEIKAILRDTMTTEFKDPKTGVVTKVPEGVGGGCVSVDRAVLKVVNDMRKKAGLAPLTMDNVEAAGLVTLVAEGEGTEWKVTASVAGPSGETVLVARLDGEGAVGGDTEQEVHVSGSGTWSITVKDPATVHVKRTDTEACARVQVGVNPLVGTWSYSVRVPGNFYPGTRTPLSMVPEPREITFVQGADGTLTAKDKRGNWPVAFDGKTVKVTCTSGWAWTLTGTLEGDRITGQIAYTNPAGGRYPLFAPDDVKNMCTRFESMNGPWTATRGK